MVHLHVPDAQVGLDAQPGGRGEPWAVDGLAYRVVAVPAAVHVVAADPDVRIDRVRNAVRQVDVELAHAHGHPDRVVEGVGPERGQVEGRVADGELVRRGE